MKKAPIKIDHQHIVDSVVEIRFNPTTKNNFFMTLLTSIAQILPNSEYVPNDIPKQLRESDPQLKFQVEGNLRNDEFIVGIGNSSIIFNCRNGYKTWKEFFPFIVNTLEVVRKLNIVGQILRIGIRYTNFFEGNNNIQGMLKLDLRIGQMENDNNQFAIRTSSPPGTSLGYNISIANPANYALEGNIRLGTLVDIDAFSDKDLPNGINTELISKIEFIHQKEKDMFFSILDEKFLQSLNPTYD